MVKLKEVRYGRKFFLGGYETFSIEFATELEDGDGPHEAIEIMREAANIQHDIEKKEQKSLIPQSLSGTEDPDPITNRLALATEALKKNGNKAQPAK